MGLALCLNQPGNVRMAAHKVENPIGVPDRSPGLRRLGATPGRWICLKISPVRAAQPLQGCCVRVSLPGVGAKRANPGLCTEALSGLWPTEIHRCGTFCRASTSDNLAKRPRAKGPAHNSPGLRCAAAPGYCISGPSACFAQYKSLTARTSSSGDGKASSGMYILLARPRS